MTVVSAEENFWKYHPYLKIHWPLQKETS